MTQSDSERLEAKHSRTGCDHYLIKQLQPIADTLFQRLGNSVVALRSAQKVLF